jgi:hypothetical protein
MTISKFITTQPAKRIRPAAFTIQDLERYISAHEGLNIHFRTAQPFALIRNVGLYTGSYPWKKTALQRLPLALTDGELHQRIRLYTDLGYVINPYRGVVARHDPAGGRAVIYLQEQGSCSGYERYPDKT